MIKELSERGQSKRVLGFKGRVRRNWSAFEKERIVLETLGPAGDSVSVVARRYDVNANQVFAWKRAYERGALGERGGGSLAEFVSVGVIGSDLAALPAPSKPVSLAKTERAASTTGCSMIEIKLPRGIRVRTEANAAAMAAVIVLLRGLKC